MVRRLYIVLVLFLIEGELVFAQTIQGPIRISMPFPVHSQYLQNGLVINPAYAGSREALTFFTSIRKQWFGLGNGSPLFETLSMHSLLKNDRVALGLTSQFLTYGPTKATSIYGIYAYHLNLGTARLSLGLRGGLDISNTNYSNLILIKPLDPAFTGDFKPYIMPNVGAGFYLYNKKFFFGASIPQFLSYIKTTEGKVSFNTFQKFDIEATAGLLIKLADVLKFKPSVYLDYSLDKTKQTRVDINGNFIICDIVWVGGSYRTSEKAAVGILQLQVNPQIMAGFSYDYPLGNLSNYSNGSFEAVLRYEFGYKVTAANPRYF